MSKYKLVLIATTKPWQLPSAIEELGDALFRYDESVNVYADERVPLLYVFSCKLEPMQAFKLVVREPPASIERVIPVEYLVKLTANIEDSSSVKHLIDVLYSLIRDRVKDDTIGLEVKPRGFFMLGGDDKRWNNVLSNSLTALVGLRILRKSDYVLKLEDTRYGIAAAIMKSKWDRMQTWRKMRLGNTSAEESKR